jgi:hypothetical protein
MHQTDCWGIEIEVILEKINIFDNFFFLQSMQYSNRYLILQKPRCKKIFGMRRAFAKHNMGYSWEHFQQGPLQPLAPFF